MGGEGGGGAYSGEARLQVGLCSGAVQLGRQSAAMVVANPATTASCLHLL